jgi:hypothetical protein
VAPTAQQAAIACDARLRAWLADADLDNPCDLPGQLGMLSTSDPSAEIACGEVLPSLYEREAGVACSAVADEAGETNG